MPPEIVVLTRNRVVSSITSQQQSLDVPAAGGAAGHDPGLDVGEASQPAVDERPLAVVVRFPVRPRANPAESADEAMEPTDLAALMTAYQAGELAAFEELYAQLAPRLRSYLGALVRDDTRAQDLVQETFLQIHRARHTYDPARRLEPWVFALARHVFLMDRRARYRRGRHEEVATGPLPDVPLPPVAASLADTDRVRRGLAALTPEACEAVLLHHVWGFSFREIAAMLAINVGAARVRASRGMAELRRLIGAPPEGEGSR
jgi:RNA polymerase sigma-70 factor (ECF subfamily)